MLLLLLLLLLLLPLPRCLQVCFSAALIISLLREGLHLPPAAPLLNPSNSITTPQGKTLEAKWPLGALVVGLLQTGGSGLTATPALTPAPTGKTPLALTPKRDKPHVHPMLGSGGGGEEDTGMSAGSAAAVAAMFCMAMLATSLCLSWLGVGLPGNGRCGALCLRLWRGISRKGGVGAVGAAESGGVTTSSTNGSNGGSVVRYMRVRPSSRTDTYGPRSRSASPAGGSRMDEGVGGVGGSIMLTVLPGGAEWSAADWDSSESPVAIGVSGGGGGGSSVGVAKGGRPLTARQR